MIHVELQATAASADDTGSDVVTVPCGTCAECPVAEEITVHALDMAADGVGGPRLVIGGASNGALMFYHLDDDGPGVQSVRHVRTIRPGGGSGTPVVDVKALPGSSLILAVHDATFVAADAVS